MLRVFVADDEDIIREGIRECIEKESPHLLFAGEAPDGEMALPLLMEMKPDVLVTDVRMPFMDGLELAKVVRKSMPWMRLVFLSGHDEFEYAQQAVSLQADAYLLKPIDAGRLLQTLHEVVERMEREREHYHSTVRSKILSGKEAEILKEHFLSELLTGAVTPGMAAENAQRWGIALTARCYIVCQMEMKDCAGLRKQQVESIVEHAFAQQQDIIWFFHGNEHLAMIIKGEDSSSMRERAYEVAQLLRHECKHYLEMDVTIGIGTAAERISELSEAYAHAKQAVQGVFSKLPGSIVGYEDISHKAPAASGFDFMANVPLHEKLRHALPEDADKILTSYFGTENKDDVQSVLYRYYLLMDILVTARRMESEIDEKGGNTTVLIENPQEVLQRAATLEGAKEYASQILHGLIQKRCRHENVRYNAEILRAKQFIKEKYADDSLSLHTVAAEVGFSPNHFSTIFSQETGETFVEYLTHIRIENAKLLLQGVGRRLADIAFDVGYHEPRYFGYLFKKHTGMTPREYRMQNVQDAGV